MQFAGEHQERLSVDDKLGGGAPGFEVGRAALPGRFLVGQALLRRKRNVYKSAEEQRHWQHKKSHSHVATESTTADFTPGPGLRGSLASRPCESALRGNANPFQLPISARSFNCVKAEPAVIHLAIVITACNP
jgi:hypothetical protein